MSGKIYRITGTLVFPEGLAIGEGRESNVIAIARNGAGDPVLRGTSLCGALRAAYAEVETTEAEKIWFGDRSESADDEGVASLVTVSDTVLHTGKAGLSVRTHNHVNRHTGTVVKQGLFCLEQLPPGTSGKLCLYVDTRGMEEGGEAFVDALCAILGSRLTLGGNRNRGIGCMQCAGDTVTVNEFDVATMQGYAAWIDARFADRTGSDVPGEIKRNLTFTSNKLVVELKLAIPRGEDVLVGYGTTLEHQDEPQQASAANGKKYWRIPGSSLRGVFRGWISRLAARTPEIVIRDSFKRYDSQWDKDGQPYKPHETGNGFTTPEDTQVFAVNPDQLNDPVLDLFGSIYQRGRIHINDALSTEPADPEHESHQRMHVAVDRFSGGANEGGLFSNVVLCGGTGVTFATTITIDTPENADVQWLSETLKALDIGLLRFGSSKASGMLEIVGLSATGPKADQFKDMVKETRHE